VEAERKNSGQQKTGLCPKKRTFADETAGDGENTIQK